MRNKIIKITKINELTTALGTQLAPGRVVEFDPLIDKRVERICTDRPPTYTYSSNHPH